MSCHNLYIGSFQNSENAPITRCEFDFANGDIRCLDSISAFRPSWLSAVSDSDKLLFLEEANEINGKYGGSVGMLDVSGLKMNITSVKSIGAKGPTHISVFGRFAFLSCYSEGSLVQVEFSESGEFSSVKEYRHSGSSVHPIRQTAPHVHFSLISPDNRYLAVCDLGIDQILLYPIDSEKGIVGAPIINHTPAGAGPRHAVFSKDGRFLYVVTEMGCSVLVYEYSSSGILTLKQTVSTLPKDISVNSQCGAIRLSPCGNELFVTNRGVDNIAFFKVEPDGNLTPSGSVNTELWPRDAVFSPDGNWVICANQKSDSLNIYSYGSDMSIPFSERVRPEKIIRLPKNSAPCCLLFSC